MQNRSVHTKYRIVFNIIKINTHNNNTIPTYPIKVEIHHVSLYLVQNEYYNIIYEFAICT